MADTQLELIGALSSNAEEQKNHLMKVFEDVTKDCKDEGLRILFDKVVDYDALNACAVRMFSGLADLGFLDEAKELFKPLPEQTTLPEVAVFTLVIMGYAFTGNTKDAHSVYQQMIASGVTPTTFSYTVLVSKLAQDFSNPEFLGYAKKYFLEMLDRGMKPHYQSYMYVMDAIAYREPVEEAKKFLEQIKAKGYKSELNDIRYKERYLTEAMQVVHMCTDLVHSNTIDKDVQTFVLKLRACPISLVKQLMKMHSALLEDGNVDEAAEFYNIVKQKRIEPIVLIHTTIIEAYLKFGKTKGALEAYLTMLAAGVAPNSYTYTVLIKGLAADPEFFGNAKKYLLEMMDKGKQPNASTYTAVMEGFARKEDSAAEDEGKEFVKVMLSKGFVPNAKAMREVLRGKPMPVIQRIMNIVLSLLKG